MKPKKTVKAPSKKKPRAKRAAMPQFFRIDEEMKQWASLLEGELVKWPGVKTKPMFGGAGWHAYALRSRDDIKDALWWLNQAYECVK